MHEASVRDPVYIKLKYTKLNTKIIIAITVCGY